MNNRILLMALGGGAVTSALLLMTRRAFAARVAPLPQPIPQQPLPQQPVPQQPPMTYGESTKVSLSVPGGWRRVKNSEVSVLPELGSKAVALRNTAGFTSMQYGTLNPFVASDGNEYATWVEQHFHEPGGSVRPWGLHHGVTLLAKIRTG